MTIETTVGELVRAVPARARVFEKLGIDYCCGGKKPLAETCAAKGLDPAAVLEMLEASDAAPDPGLADADAMGLSALCDHIETAHHAWLREELPRLDFMTRKVAAVHGGEEPRLTRIREVFAAFAPELLGHVIEEEDAVFPRIRKLETDPSGDGRGELRAVLDRLEGDHWRTSAALADFRELTDGYAPPEWACNTFRALYDGLARLERDTHRHIHKENNVLFPRALAGAG